jgi:phosphate transport system substrate-binding protein
MTMRHLAMCSAVVLAAIASAPQKSYAASDEPGLSALPSYKPDTKVVGAVRVFGSFLKGTVELLEKGFLKFHPDAEFANSFFTSSEGSMAGLYAVRADVAPAGDDAKLTDMMPFKNTFRYLPLEVSIATGGYEARGTLWAFAVVVNKDNPIDKLSVDQLARVFGAERTGGWEIATRDGIQDYYFTAKYARGPETNIRSWGQLGLGGEWSKQEIQTYGYVAPGFAVYFERNWFHWSSKWNPNFRQYVEEKQTTPDEAGAAVASERPLEEISNNKYGIGLAALMHVKNYPNLKVLAVAEHEGGPYVALTPENVKNRTYPLKRDAFVYVNRAPGQPLDAKAKEFLRFVLSREGQEIIAGDGQYYPLTPDYLREQLKKLD